MFGWLIRCCGWFLLEFFYHPYHHHLVSILHGCGKYLYGSTEEQFEELLYFFWTFMIFCHIRNQFYQRNPFLQLAVFFVYYFLIIIRFCSVFIELFVVSLGLWSADINYLFNLWCDAMYFTVMTKCMIGDSVACVKDGWTLGLVDETVRLWVKLVEMTTTISQTTVTMTIRLHWRVDRRNSRDARCRKPSSLLLKVSLSTLFHIIF